LLKHDVLSRLAQSGVLDKIGLISLFSDDESTAKLEIYETGNEVEEIQYLCKLKRRFFMKAKHIKDYYVLFICMLYETYSATSICTGK